MAAVKTGIQELAIFGGAPAFAEPRHVGRPNLGDRSRLLQRIEGILDRNWLTNNGPLVQQFETEVARRAGVRHCVAMTNGTVALEIATRALGLSGEVIVPSFTFVATAHALQWQEITPVFCDIDPRTLTLDPARVEAQITPKTSGIIGVHTWGRPCDADALGDIATKHGLPLLFDAAHAFGCSYKGRSIGSLGSAEVFSFHATKFVNCFEGGAVVTDDSDLAEKMRLMRNFGFVEMDRSVYLGTNGKMSEVCAAMGLTSLESIDEFVARNQSNWETYRRGLESLPGLRLLEPDGREQCNFQYVVVEVEASRCGLSRDALLRVLREENVLARRYFWPGCHRMEPYRSLFPDAGRLLPQTEALASRVLVLPTGTSMFTCDVQAICSILRTALEHADQLVDIEPGALAALVGT